MENPKIRFKGFTKDWEQRKLGYDLVSIHTGTNLLGSITNTGMPLIKMGNIQRGYFDTSKVEFLAENEQPDKADIANYGDFFFNTRNTLELVGKGATWMKNSGEYAFNSNIARFELRNLDTIFFNYLYNTDYMTKQIHARAMGTTSVAAIYPRTLDSVEYLVPCMKEQQKIGAYFKQLDHIITLHQRKCEQTKKLKKYMLQKMFPQNGAKVPEIRFDGFTYDWEQRKLSEITTMHARIGWQNLRTSEFLDSGDYMLITGTDFNDGAINYSTCHFVERERYEQDKHIQIKNGSILITKDGTLGKVAYVQGLSMPATLNAGVFNVEIKDETEVNDKYLFQYLKAPFLMDYVNKKATGGTIKHLNQNILVDFPVFMPSKAEQEEIGTYFEKLDNLITLHQRKCDELKKMKKYMLQNMFI